LNLNPDRYISARVTKGDEPDTLAVDYSIYEANPWHWFLQIDNAGTKDRRYTPRVGLINTNLLGFDDELTIFYQAPWESGIEDRYSLYGSYDVPVFTPKLRLTMFAGYSQFDIDGGGGIDFLGHGSVYGGELRYNLFREGNWFFDVISSLSREESKIGSSDKTFESLYGIPLPNTGKVIMDLWGIGVDLHKRSDMSNTSVRFDRVENIGGSSQRRFWDKDAQPIATGIRTNSKRNFALYTTAATHSQYLDDNKVQRFSGSVRYIVPDKRVAPSKMTTFGGMYSVRGYKESGIVADGGVLASVQYEYDLVKQDAANGMVSDPDNKLALRKLAPLVFFDYGRARTEDALDSEDAAQELYSVGVGGLIEIGKNLSGAVYYGFPLQDTSTTDTGDGRLNLSLLLRW